MKNVIEENTHHNSSLLKREQIKYKVKRFLWGSKDKQGVGKQIFVYVLLIAIGFIYLYPVLYMISKSFMDLNDLLDSSINWIPSKLNVSNSNFAHRFSLCTLKIQYLAVIQLSKSSCYAA